MQNFSYNSTVSDAQNIVVERKRKINRHRLIYLIIFWLGVLSLIWYIFFSIRWINVYGTIKANNQQITLMHDAYITKIKVKTGDRINKGDTLFEFIYTSTVRQDSLSIYSINSSSWLDREYLSETREIALKESNILVIDKQIKILEEHIAIIKKQIFLGVATENDLIQKSNELRLLNMQREKTSNEIEISKRFLSEINLKITNTPTINPPSEYIIHELDSTYILSSRYAFPYVAKYDGMIINVTNLENTYCYKQNSVMEIMPLNDSLLNFHVEAMVYPDQMEDIKQGDKVDIIVTNNKIHKGEVEFLGYRTTEIPKHLQLPFEKNNTAILVRIKFLENDNIDLWEKTTGVPVTVKKSRF